MIPHRGSRSFFENAMGYKKTVINALFQNSEGRRKAGALLTHRKAHEDLPGNEKEKG